jgi:type VI secretion system protein ImpH
VTLANCNGFDEARQSMAFPASAVHNIEENANQSDPAHMTIAFMGLTGVQGALPLYYTERMLASKAAKDDSLAAFLDIFNHRLISLFYRAWEDIVFPFCTNWPLFATQAPIRLRDLCSI